MAPAEPMAHGHQTREQFGDRGDLCGAVAGLVGLLCDGGDGDDGRAVGSLASGVVVGMREEESVAAQSCGFGRSVSCRGDDYSSLSVQRLCAADEACPLVGARRESYDVISHTSSPLQIPGLLHGETDDGAGGGAVNGSSVVGGSGVYDAAGSCGCGVAAGAVCLITLVCLRRCCHAHPPDEAFAVATASRHLLGVVPITVNYSAVN